MHKLIKKQDCTTFNKNGVDFIGYNNVLKELGIVVETVEKGHFEEFLHTESTFIYIILEGKGTFYLNEEEVAVEQGDLLIVEPNTKIYYTGKLKQVLITTPAWTAEKEIHIRNITQ